LKVSKVKPKLNQTTSHPYAIYYIMSEQPNCCPHCQFRLEVNETVMIENEVIQVNFCEECQLEILMIDED
jgi:hypothetical protein